MQIPGFQEFCMRKNKCLKTIFKQIFEDLKKGNEINSGIIIPLIFLYDVTMPLSI